MSGWPKDERGSMGAGREWVFLYLVAWGQVSFYLFENPLERLTQLFVVFSNNWKLYEYCAIYLM